MQVLQLLPRFRQIEAELKRFEERESWSANDIAEYQLGRINELWSTARQSVPYYIELSRRHHLPDRFDSLAEFTERIPLLPKQLVRDQPQQFFSRQPQPGSWHRTGGSTGVPTSIYWSHAAHREMLRSKYRSEQAYGVNVFDRKVFFWGHSGSFAPGMQGRIQRVIRPWQDWLRNRLRVSAYDLAAEHLVRYLAQMQQFSPHSVYGYSSAIDLLAEAAAKHSVTLPDLKLAILTAEPADSRMLSRVTQKLGVPAVIEYGAVECGLMAYLMPDGTIRTRDDVVFVETAPTGKDTHDIIVTVLNNPSFPLMRYQIEDTTTVMLRRPAQGFGILSDIQGRSNDMLISKSGNRLHSMAVKHVLEHWPEIRRFTARQSTVGDMKVTLEATQDLSEDLVGSLQDRLESMLEGYSVEMEVVDSIPGNLAGKHRWIVSDLAGQPQKGSGGNPSEFDRDACP